MQSFQNKTGKRERESRGQMMKLMNEAEIPVTARLPHPLTPIWNHMPGSHSAPSLLSAGHRSASESQSLVTREATLT